MLRPDLYLAYSCAGYIEVPNRVYAAEQIRSGSLPEWTPLVLNGWPLFAESVTAVLYPGFLMYVIYPDPKTNDFFHAAHLLLAMYFIYLFLRRVNVRQDISLICSIAWMYFADFLGTSASPPVLSSLIWLPLSLLLLDKTSDQARRLWGVMVVNTFVLLAGHPQGAFLTFVAQIIWIAATWRDLDISKTIRMILSLFVIPVMIAFVQILPLYDYFVTSHRYSEGAELRERLPLMVFLSLSVLSGVLAAGPLIWRREKSVVIAIATMAIVSVSFSSDGPGQWVLHRLPVVGNFQIPALYIFLAVFSLVVIVGMVLSDGLSWLTSSSNSKDIYSYAIMITVALVSYTVAVEPDLRCSKNFYQSISECMPPEIINNDTTRLRSFSHRIEKLAPSMIGSRDYLYYKKVFEDYAILCPPNCNLIPHVAVSGIFNQDETLTPRDIGEFDELMIGSMNLNLFWAAGITHIASTQELALHQDGKRQVIIRINQRDVSDIVSHRSLVDSLVIDSLGTDSQIAGLLPSAPSEPEWITNGATQRGSFESIVGQLQGSAGAAGWSSDCSECLESTSPNGHEVDIKASQRMAEPNIVELRSNPIWIYRLEPRGHRAWMVYETKFIPNHEERLAFLDSDHFSPFNLAIVEKSQSLLIPSSHTASNEVQVKQITPKWLSVEVETDQKGLCVLSDRFDDHLVATIDGQKTEIFKTNHAFCGVLVPEGRHKVEIRYHNKYLLYATLISLAGVIATLVFWVQERHISSE
ncbi:YfhO family protein [bacterium]|nr:YfhO family protein [bacterium]